MNNLSLSRAALGAGFAWMFGACHADVPVEPVAADTIDVVWRMPMAGLRPGNRGLTVSEGRLYTLNHGVSAHRADTGELLWSTPGVQGVPDNVVTSHGRVFVSEFVARALDASTGVERWRFVPDTLADRTSAVDDRAYYFGTRSHRVYALDIVTGARSWVVDLLPQTPFVAFVDWIVTSGDTVYASLIEDVSPTGHLKRGVIVALDRHTGREHWRYVNERAGESHDATYHAVAGRMLLVNDRRGGAMIGVDRFTAREVWRYVGPADRFGAWDDFKVADGVAYVASNDTYVYALDPETGRIHWKTQLKGSANSSAVCGDYVFAADGSLHKLRRSDGKEVASLFLDRNGSVGNEWVRSRLLAHGNRVYFVGNRAVYAVSCE
jgi:outer membrane protein assembly factor BamB